MAKTKCLVCGGDTGSKIGYCQRTPLCRVMYARVWERRWRAAELEIWPPPCTCPAERDKNDIWGSINDRVLQ